MSSILPRRARRIGATIAVIVSLVASPALEAGAVVMSAPGASVASAHNGYLNPPVLTSVTSNVYRQDGHYYQAVTATWNGMYAVPTLRQTHAVSAHNQRYVPLSFLCTLLYGYGAPSSFTISTSTNTCRFTGLVVGQSYGVKVQSVVNYNVPILSAPTSAFAPLPRVTYRCVSGRHVRVYHDRTKLVCPPGWKLR